MSEKDHHIFNYQRISVWLSIVAATLFALGLLGWIFNIENLNRLMLNWRPARPITCIAGLVIALGNILAITCPRRKILIASSVLFPAALAILSLGEILVGSEHALLDRLFPASGNEAIPHPGRMSLSSSVLFIIAATAHALQSGRQRRIHASQLLALVISFDCLFILFGHLYQCDEIISSEGRLYISMYSTIGMMLLSIALLLRNPAKGIIDFYRQKSVSVRENLLLLARTAAILIMVSWLRYKGEQLGWFDSHLGLTFMTTIILGVLAIVITISARKLNRAEQLNNQLVQRLDQNKAELEDILNGTSDGIFMVNRDLVVTYANPHVVRAENKPLEEIVGFHILKLFFVTDLYEPYRERIEQAFETQQPVTISLYSKQFDLWIDNHIFPAQTSVTIFYKNITAQKKAEQELFKAKDSYQSLVENLNDLVLRINTEGEMLYISPYNETISHQVRSELIDQFKAELAKFPFPSKQSNIKNHTGDIQPRELVISILEGIETMVFEVRYSPEYDSAGQWQTVLAICRDVTESYKTREVKTRLTSVIENMTAMVAQADSSLMSVYINPAGREMLGIDKDAPVPFVHISKYTTEAAGHHVQAVALPYALEHGSWMGKSVLLSTQGKIFPVMLILIVHNDAAGNFSYLSSIAYDLTDANNQEVALRDSEQRWQFAVDGSNLGLWDWNIQTNGVFFSRRYINMLGYLDHEFRGDFANWRSIVHSDDYPVVVKELDDYLKKVKPEYDLIYRLRKKDESYMHVRARGMITEYSEDGSPKRMIGTIADVSLAFEQALLLNKTKEELRSLAIHLQDIREEERLNLSRMIHEELGQQLSSLKMYLSSFESKPDQALKENRLKLDNVLRTLETSIHVVQKMSVDLRPSIIEDLGLVDSLQSLTQDFQVRFDIRIRFSSLIDSIETASKTALCFYRAYQEALSNIARHSLATRVAVRLTISDDGMLILAIKDDGIGFKLAEKNAKTNFGLVEIRERMLMVNGQMDIHSAPGKGTLLVVKAPMSSNQE